MQSNNPYAAPNATVKDRSFDNTKFGKISITNTRGRIGRLRYIVYTLGITFIGSFLAIALMLIPYVGGVIGGLAYVLVFVFTVFLTIQRCHDFNKTAWLALIMLIPIVSLIFYFISGTKGENRFGLQTPPNSKGVKIGAFLIVAVFVLGILAAVAIPVFQGNIAQKNALLPE